MKITITVPDKKAKALIATAALASGEEVPKELVEAIEKSPEIDVTQLLEEDSEMKIAISSLTLLAIGQLIAKLEDEKENQEEK